MCIILQTNNNNTSFLTMATEEDNFDIDIYGDGEGEGEGGGDISNDANMDYKDEDEEVDFGLGQDDSTPVDEPVVKHDPDSVPEVPTKPQQQSIKTEATSHNQIKTEDTDASKSHPVPAKPTSTPQQGTKRKETSDDRPIDAGATNALMISDLHWWTTEDDIRGWANDADTEDELKEITFSEHKVNGKSKG